MTVRSLRYSALGAYASSKCHYCGGKATTSDHIVPRCAFADHQSALPYWYRAHNIAPCCHPCNWWKDSYRSDCHCQQCTWVWDTGLALFVRADYVVRVRPVLRLAA